MNVFLSVGARYNHAQEEFVSALKSFLVTNDCRQITVDDRRSDQPIFAARELMQKADAAIVVAFTRFVVVNAVEKPGSPDERPLANVCYPTIWNQLEAAMAFGLNLPLLVIIEEGLHQEAMLKDRLEFRTVVTKLDPTLFSSDVFREKFKHWMARVREPRTRVVNNIAELTVGQLLSQLRPDQIWAIGAALFAFTAAVATASFWIGSSLR